MLGLTILCTWAIVLGATFSDKKWAVQHNAIRRDTRGVLDSTSRLANADSIRALLGTRSQLVDLLTSVQSNANEERKTEHEQTNSMLHESIVKRFPSSVDWRAQGYVTPVKNQEQCGSSYAFAATGAIEGQHFKKSGTLVSLSEQNIVDCTNSYGNEGCKGGSVLAAFKYVRDNRGIDSETGYPYYARHLGYCYYNSKYNTAEVSGYMQLPAGDENALQLAVATVGPIAANIDSSGDFWSYRSGVFISMSCGNQLRDLNQHVLIVGYGSLNGQDYWLIKNSVGITWGEAGYMKLARNRNNMCGIASQASYPLV